MRVPEINRLDKIARRSKRVGGAIADLWGGQYLCFSSGLTVEKSSWTEKSISRGLYQIRARIDTASTTFCDQIVFILLGTVETDSPSESETRKRNRILNFTPFRSVPLCQQ